MYPDLQSTVLITDISTRKSFDLANILLSQGMDILLCDDIRGYKAWILSKAYGRSVERLSKERFDEDLATIAKKYSDKKLIYFPIEEDTTLKVYKFLKTSEISNLYLNLPPEESFEIVRDKKSFSRFCMQNEQNIPKEYDYRALVEERTLPSKLIVKPKNGSGAMGIKYIDSKEDLLSLNLNFDNYIIQQRLDGEKDIKGAFFLFDKGELIAYYGHKRLRTYPSRGGVSVYSKCHMDEELKRSGCGLLRKLKWSGLAMVEFLYDEKSGEHKIIEVNPRVWGSIMLSEFCGSRMIENYCKSALGYESSRAEADTRKYIRWFFPWDIVLYIQKRGKIKDFWKFQKRDCCYINFTYSPWSGALLFTFYNLINPDKIKTFLKKVLSK